MPTGIDRNEILKSAKSIELLSHFRNQKTWISETPQSEGMLKLLGAHAHKYFSPLRAAFLFQFKSAGSLEYYSPILVRDGALTLLHFFLHRPIPQETGPYLIVEKRLQHLVPSAWRENVFGFELQSLQADNQKSGLIFVLSNLGEKQASTQSVQKAFKEFENRTKTQPQHVVVIATNSENHEYSKVRDSLTKQQNQLLLEISKCSPTTVQVLTADDMTVDLSDYYFADLNDHLFYYSDSSLLHSLWRQGATDLSKVSQKGLLHIPLSFYHEIRVDNLEATSPAVDLALKDYLSSTTLMGEEKNHNPKKINFDQKVTTKSFESFAYRLASRI